MFMAMLRLQSEFKVQVDLHFAASSIEIERQDVDARLAKDAELKRLSVA